MTIETVGKRLEDLTTRIAELLMEHKELREKTVTITAEVERLYNDVNKLLDNKEQQAHEQTTLN